LFLSVSVIRPDLDRGVSSFYKALGPNKFGLAFNYQASLT